MLNKILKLLPDDIMLSEYERRGLGDDKVFVSDEDAILSLYRNSLKTIELDFTVPYQKYDAEMQAKFWGGDSEKEMKDKLMHFHNVYNNPVFVEYLKDMINKQSLFTLSEARTQEQIMAGRMQVIALSSIMDAFKHASEMYEQKVYKANMITDAERYSAI